MALIHQIEEVEYEIGQLQMVIHRWNTKLLDLKLRRSQCNHKFSKPIAGYEHEGGTCSVCGIGEAYARCNQIGNCG